MRQVQIDGLEELGINGSCEDGDRLKPEEDEAVEGRDWCGKSGCHVVSNGLSVVSRVLGCAPDAIHGFNDGGSTVGAVREEDCSRQRETVVGVCAFSLGT